MPLRLLRLLPLLVVLASANASAQAPAGGPALKPGLWEKTSTSDRPSAKLTGPHTESVCVDASVQSLLLAYAQQLVIGKCGEYTLAFAGNVGKGEAACQVGGSTKKVKSTITVTGNTAFKVEVDATYAPPLMGMSKVHEVVDARHVGPCPAGWQPGDVRAAEGPGINLQGTFEMPAPKKGP